MKRKIFFTTMGIILLLASMNVSASNSGQRKAAQPDLIISSIHRTYAQLVVNQFDTFTAYVTNVGTKKSPPTRLKFQVGGSLNFPNIPEIDPNQSFSVSRTTSFSQVGTYIITAQADIDNVVMESNESNNTKQITVQVVDQGNPDLYISDITWTTPNVNQNIQITVTVMNKLGCGMAPATKLRFKIGGESNPPLFNILPLAPGQNHSIGRGFTPTSPGNFIITATADAQNDAPEKNEGNNTMSKTLVVKPLLNGADLDLISATPNHTRRSWYQDFVVTAVVKNEGNLSSGPFNVHLYRVHDYPAGTAQGTKIDMVKSCLSLAPNQTCTVQFKFKYKYYLGDPQVEIKVDPEGSVNDYNRANNQRQLNLKVI